MPTVPGWKDLGRCGTCGGFVKETDSGTIVGHRDTCPNKGQAP